MVTKKSLEREIDFLLNQIQKLYEENKKLEQKVTEMSEKVEFVYRKTDSLTIPQGSLFDEWMNGAQKEGEN